MKKLLLGSVAVFTLAAVPAIADHHKGGGNKHAKMFEKHDANGDGIVSKDEFMAHAEEKFGKMDADGDGNITQEESKAYHEKKRANWKEKKEKMKEMKEMKEEKSAE